MGMVSRLLVFSGLVVARCLTMMTSSVGVMLLRFLVVFGGFLRHRRFPPFRVLDLRFSEFARLQGMP